MKLKASLHKHIGGGTLQWLGEGECTAYSPEARNGGKEYVSLNFGEIRIHVDKDDFEKYCRHFLKFSVRPGKRKELTSVSSV